MKNKFSKKIIASVLSVLLISMMVIVSGCGSKDGSSSSKYNIGVIQFVQHDALDASNKGFVQAFKDAGIKADFDQQNASGDMSASQTIANSMQSSNKDLIFAIATPAAQAIAGVDNQTPIVVTAVTDPADAKLVKSNDKPETNVTGTSDLTPVDKQFGMLKELLPDAKKVGIIYCSAESNSVLQAKMAKEEAKNNNLEAEEFTISSTNEVQSVIESMVGKVDVIYAPTDNMVASSMSTISQIATENKLPIICGEEGMLDNGGFATVGIDYFELGYKAGQMAIEILKNGKNPKDMPIEYLDASKCERAINKVAAEKLGIDISDIKDIKLIGE